MVDGWQTIKLGEICTIEIGGTPTRNNDSYWDTDKQTNNIWVSIKDMKSKYIEDTEEYITDRGVRNSNAKLFPKGTLLMSFKLTIGRVALCSKDLYTNEAITAITPKDDKQIDNQFLYYKLPSVNPEKYCDVAIKGETLNKSKLKIIELELPCEVLEQSKIAEILFTVDEAIDKTEALIQKYQRIKQGLMQDLLTRGIDENGNIRNEETHRFKDSPVGRIPVEWDVVKINQISEVRRGASPRPISDQRYFSDKGRGWVRISDVTDTYKYLKKTSQYLSQIGESKGIKVEPGDLIMSICATIGKPVIVDMHACIHDGFVVFRNLSDRANVEFIFYILVKNELEFVGMKQIGTQGNLNTTIVRESYIPLPPLTEQYKIIEILSNADDLIGKTEIFQKKLQAIKRGLMNDLLTGKVRVNSLLEGHQNGQDSP